MCSAPRFQLIIVPSKFLPMIASSDESIMEARRDRYSPSCAR